MKHVFQTDRKIIEIDCRELVPPGPMIQVLEAVETMKKDEAILMIHRKNPIPLYDRLEERGCHYQLKEFEDGSIQLLIWKKSP